MRIRSLYVKAVATTDFKKHYKTKWQEVIEKTIQNTSEVFEKEFGIKLIIKMIKTRIYRPQACVSNDFFDYVGNFRNESCLDECDVTIIFTDVPYFWGEGYRTLASIYNNELIFLPNPEKTKIYLECYKSIDLSFLKPLLIHELSHLFGAENVADKNSYMAAIMTSNPVVSFDEVNKKIILRNKWRKFQ